MAKKSAAKKATKSAAKKPVAKVAAKKSVAKKPEMKAKAAVKASPKLASKVAPKVAPKMETPKSAAKVEKSSSKSGFVRFNPLDDRIVIERVVAPEKTAGGLYIPDSAQEKPTIGKVVAVGRGHRDAKGRTRPCDVKVGDRVLFTAWSGSEIEMDGQKFVIMRETDLLGVTTA